MNSKTIKVKYTIEVIRDVIITDEEPPAPYSPEEWEEQQIQNVCYDIEFALDGKVSSYYQRLE